MIDMSVSSESTVDNFKVLVKSEDKKHWHELLVPAIRQDELLVNDTQDDDLLVLATPHPSLWVGQTKLQNLASGTRYSVRVASRNNFGFSPFSQPYTLTTPPRTQPVTSSSSSESAFIISSLSLFIIVTSNLD